MQVVRENLIVPNNKEIYYINIGTRGLVVPGSGVTGTKENFTAQIETLNLDPNKHYTVEIISLKYRNRNTPGAGVYFTVLSNIGENIRVNNTNSSVIYESNIDGTNNQWLERDTKNNFNFVLPLANRNINQINVQCVRSDNGQPWPFQNNSEVSIVFKIESL